MSTWHALNVEPENEEEVEIDDTKEIQIEEALKLYQTALKHHAEGPQSFERTAEAYKALFESEIFKYHESLSEYKRHELYGDELVFDSILDDFDAGPVQAAGGTETAPNTLPQLLHLSYKNHGQFILETMQHWAKEHGIPLQQDSPGHVVSALSNFADALDKEDTDLDLWLRTASVAAMLGSSRITRFCLEAVLDGNDEAYDSLLRLPGLEEGFAGHQLRELVGKLEDSLSLEMPPLAALKKKKLSETLKKRLNPYPWAPVPSEISPPIAQAVERPPQRVILSPLKWDWAGAGDVVLRHYMAEINTVIENIQPGCAIALGVPPEATIIEPVGNVDVEEVVVTEPPKEDITPEQDKLAASAKEPDNSAKDGEDTVMADQEKPETSKVDDGESTTLAENGRELSRKRSTDSAGLPETAEGGRARSKRLRARDSEAGLGAEAMGQAVSNTLEDQLWPFTNADKCLREVVNDQFERLGVEGLGKLEELRDLVSNSSTGATATDSIDKAACDMYTALQTSGSKIAPVLLSAEPMDLGGASREAGLNAFLGYSKSSTAQACIKPTLQSEKLTSFVQSINNAWLSTQEVAFSWVEALLTPGFLSTTDSTQSSKSSYIQYRWAEDLKRQVVQVLVNVDEFIHSRMLDRLEALNDRILEAQEQVQQYTLSTFDTAQIEIIETIFELHLDVYSLIKHPSSGVNQSTQTEQNDRLSRWVSLAREAMQLRSSCQSNVGPLDELSLRHIWASVFQLSVDDEVLPQHVFYAMEELKEIFKSSDGHTVEVQNNAVMPELSVAAIDRELVRISMKDFFLRVFDTEEKDPVAVIESLEPILERSEETDSVTNGHADGVGEEHGDTSTADETPISSDVQKARPSPLQEMRKFLDSASVSLRLSLWQRLREAYEAIEYPPKVLSCYLRSIETLTGKFSTSTYQESSDADRHVELIRCFRIVDEIAVKVLHIIKDEKDAFACLTYEHMQSSMSAISQLLRILSAANSLQDLIRVGQHSIPRYAEGFPPSTFANITNRLNDVQVRLWILQYYLFREGISQTLDKFELPSDEQFVFLRHVHHALGVRSCGHAAGRLFLRLAKDEMLSFQDIPEPDTMATELSQVLYDLYGLKTFIDPVECQEYGSNADILDRSAATKLMTFILSQAARMNIKDLAKHELKTTIERVHGALGRPRVHEDITQNGRILKAYLKSPINPTDLLSCLKGVGTLPTKPILADASVAPAAKGWYFLMGNLALTKFKMQKRTTQQPTEDVNFAQAFFLQDLEFSSERWETWYRLAQANDTQLEEAVSWTAEKLNSSSGIELVTWQRAAIHCYGMAVNCAVREADLSLETLGKVARLYADFGNRIYASSREPFSMNAFDIKDTEKKFYSAPDHAPVYTNLPFAPLLSYTAWKFAGALFKLAARGEPDKWWNHYMLAKSLWKMHCANVDEIRRAAAAGRLPTSRNGPSWEEVIKAIVNAINTLPEKKERGREPVLEPHYKLVSVTHKLVQRKTIDIEKGVEVLSNTPFSENIGTPENTDEWEGYILKVLKSLRNADKSSWHHRIIARAAHVIYDESNDLMVAQGAKHELTQQIFTKTMAVQVWKPEHERPGRHFVYTSRYTKFFVHLLSQTGDQPNLEALARRVRRKQTDFFEHTKLWQELCQTYLQLLRRMGQIPDGQEDIVFKAMNFEEYNVQATRLEAWCQDPHTQHPALDVLRHTVELKRVNNGLTKAISIDDLLGDTFALLYNTVGPTLPPLPQEQKQLSTGTATPDAGVQPGSGAPFLPPMAQGQIDGAIPSDSHNAPFNLFHPSQLQPQPQPQPVAEPVPKPRAKTVGRREIQRRAEACAQKPAGAAAPPTTSVMPIRSPPTVAYSTLPSATTVTAHTAPSPDKSVPPEPAPTPITGPSALEPPNVSTSGIITAAASVTADERSAPASVHDDADDESELSELDEDEVQEMGHQIHGVGIRAISTSRPSLFPNLKRSMDRDVKDTDTEGDGEEEEEEVEEEEDEEEEREGEDEDGDTEMRDGDE